MLLRPLPGLRALRSSRPLAHRRARALPILLALGLVTGVAGCAVAHPAPAMAPAGPAKVVVVEPTATQRLDEAERLLGDGLELPSVRALLDAVPPGSPRRERLLGQLAELGGDDAAAEAAYARALALGGDDPDGEVRLRRALALERLGRGDEVREDLARLRPPPAPKPAKKPERVLRPLR